MANMSYCRFENTYHDLRDCADSINAKLTEKGDPHEFHYRQKLIDTCAEILETLGYEVVKPEGGVKFEPDTDDEEGEDE